MNDEDAEALYDRLKEDLRTLKPLYVIQVLVSRHPDVLKRVDERKWTLLHHACNFNASLEVINYLVQQAPDAVSALDEWNQMPLHRACSYGDVTVELLQLLVEIYPAAVGIQDSTGLTPIHCCCNSGCLADAVAYLANQRPAVVTLLQDQDGKLPLDRAQDRDDTKDGVLECLTSAMKDAACALIDVVWKDKTTLPWTVVAHVMESMSKTVTSIDDSSSGDGGTVMHQDARAQLDVPTVAILAKNDEVQALLKREDFAALVDDHKCTAHQPGEENVPVIHVVADDS